MAKQTTLDDLFNFAIEQVEDATKPIPHPVTWMEENFIDPVTGELFQLFPHQRRIIRRALQMDEDGRSRYSLVVWSEPKKSGKTTVAGAVGAYVACNIESPNEVSCVANDQEQSAGRIYAAMQPTLEKLNWIVPPTLRGQLNYPMSVGPNNTFVKAITTRYEKEAGANQGLSLWSELWAYKGERLTRLWEEMTPPPTRKFAMRWVETYAGFIGENLLLQNIYLRVFTDFTEESLQPGVTQVWPDLPVYELDNGRTLVYWSHEPRMPWQTKSYYLSQRADLRLNSYIRLHENRWVDSADTFITDEMWRNSVRAEYVPIRATYALDGSKNGDCTALVGCVKQGKQVRTTDVYIWEPIEGKEIDYGDVEDTIVAIHRKGLLIPPLWYDPYQCVKLAQDLRKRGVPCQEFPQGGLRIKADTLLFKLYNEGNMINYPHPKLRSHITAAAVREYEDQKIRIIKPGEDEEEEKKQMRIVKPDDDSSEHAKIAIHRKVDAAVAQSMAAYKAYIRATGGWGSSSSKMGKDEPN